MRSVERGTMSTSPLSSRRGSTRRILLAVVGSALAAGLVIAPAAMASAADVASVINSATVSPANLPPSGWSVTLTTTVTVQKGTTLSVVLTPPSHTPPEIYTDKYGRVKVQFHWERRSNAAQVPSTYTAMLRAVTKYSDKSQQQRTKVLMGDVEAYRWSPTSKKVTLPMPPRSAAAARRDAPSWGRMGTLP